MFTFPKEVQKYGRFKIQERSNFASNSGFLYDWDASGFPFHVHLLHQGKPKEVDTSLDKGHEEHAWNSRNLDAIFQT